jgi:hypothetical protein
MDIAPLSAVVITGCVVTCCSAVGAAGKFLFDRRDRRDAAARQHEIDVLARRAAYDASLVEKFAALQGKSEAANRQLYDEMRSDRREGVEAVATLSRELTKLAVIVAAIRSDLDQRRPRAPAPSANSGSGPHKALPPPAPGAP